MLQDYLKLNKNIIIAILSSIFLSATIAQLLVDQSDILNSTYTTIADYSIYFSVFGILYYFDHRKKYRTKSGDLDSVKLKHDLIKLITSLGIAEVVYTIARWGFQYYFLTIEYDPYLASIISQSISAVIFLLVVNLNVKIVRLYKDGN